jgi:hypothetical protein
MMMNRMRSVVWPGRNALVSSLCNADDTRGLQGDEGHSDSDFFLIFLDDRLQEGKKLFFLFGIILRVIDVQTDLPREFDVVHEGPLPEPDSTDGDRGAEYRNFCRCVRGASLRHELRHEFTSFGNRHVRHSLESMA